MVPESKQNRRYKQINFIGLQNNRHPTQHTVGNVHKTSGNCQQRPLGCGSGIGETCFDYPSFMLALI
jgi:hypothetical protein